MLSSHFGLGVFQNARCHPGYIALFVSLCEFHFDLPVDLSRWGSGKLTNRSYIDDLKIQEIQ